MPKTIHGDGQWTRLAGLVVVLTAATFARAQESAFTYQGHLEEHGSAANGVFGMAFSLWDAASNGNQIGMPINMPDVPVSAGMFMVELDFTASGLGHESSGRWLEIAVNGTTLSPREKITAAPYSIHTRGIYVNEAHHVGIGTDDPQDELHVRGDSATLRLQDDDDSESHTVVDDASPAQLLIQKVTGSGDGSVIDIDPLPQDGQGYAYIRFLRHTDTAGVKHVAFHRGNNTTQTSAVIGVDGADSYFQANGGNVGIGHTTPSSKLDVLSTGSTRAAQVTSNNASNNLTALRVDTNSSNPGVAAVAGVNTGSGMGFLAEISGSGPGLRVTKEADSLDVGADSLNTAGDGLFGDPLYLNNQSTENVIIGLGGGDCGIGTDFPGAKLHVITQSANGGNNTAAFQAPNIGSNASHIHFGTTGDWYIRSASDEGKVVIQDSGGQVEMGPHNVHPAFAYGYIDEDGAIISASSNVLSASRPFTGQYLVTVEGGFAESDIMIASANSGGSIASARLYFIDNQSMSVHTYFIGDDETYNIRFSFVVYRP